MSSYTKCKYIANVLFSLNNASLSKIELHCSTSEFSAPFAFQNMIYLLKKRIELLEFYKSMLENHVCTPTCQSSMELLSTSFLPPIHNLFPTLPPPTFLMSSLPEVNNDDICTDTITPLINLSDENNSITIIDDVEDRTIPSSSGSTDFQIDPNIPIVKSVSHSTSTMTLSTSNTSKLKKLQSPLNLKKIAKGGRVEKKKAEQTKLNFLSFTPLN